MGLDSVELLVSFEKYFGIQVSDLEAEKIATVQEMVNCVAAHLNVTDQDTSLKTELFEKLRSTLIRLQITNPSFSLTDKIFNCLDPNAKTTWVKIEKALDLQIPQPFRDADTFIKKVLYFSTWLPRYNWKTVTTDQFITAICAYNYKKLIDNRSIKNRYEILVAIIAITSNNLGVDLYEVQSEKRFADDFGID